MENTAIIVEENKINTNVTMKMSLGVIKSNLSMIEKSVDKVVSDLKNTTYAGTREDRIKMMKKDRADCNKAIAALEAERKKQKKIFSKPWDDFEIEVKSLVAKIESAATAIDNQVKTLEEERRSEVRKNIREYYDTISEPVGEFREELYQKVYDASWENVSSSMKAYKDGLKKATTDMLVLFLLRQKPMYAYEMIQKMARLSDGVLQFNTLYIAIYRLQEHGYISPSETVVTESNRTRVYFSITEQGSRYLDDIIAEYRRVTQTIDSLLSKDGVLYEGDSV